MALRTFQVTLTGSAQQISAALPAGFLPKAKWVSFFNTAAAAMTLGDANVSATRGVPLAATTGVYTPPVNMVATYGHDLTQWWVIGTATNVLNILYDDMNF